MTNESLLITTTGHMSRTARPTPPEGAATTTVRHHVAYYETDAMGIVHHGRYIPYFEEARVAYLRHLGHPYTLWREKGVDAAVLEVLSDETLPTGELGRQERGAADGAPGRRARYRAGR